MHCRFPGNVNTPSRVVFPSIIAVNGPNNVANENLLTVKKSLDQRALSDKTRFQIFFV